MEGLATIISVVPPVAIPLVVTILGVAYLYFKFKKVEDDRKTTKATRDEDSVKIHDELLKHAFEIQSLKDNMVLHNTILNDLRDQVSILNTNISKLTVQVEMLCKSWNSKV